MRAKDIQWAAALLPKLLDGVAALAKKSDALHAQVGRDGWWMLRFFLGWGWKV